MRSAAGNTIAEMPLVLIILFVLMLLPLIDLTSVVIGAITSALLVHQAASAAAVKERFDDSLSAVARESASVCSSNLAQLNKLVPLNGFQGSGIDLQITATDFHTGKVTTNPANMPLAAPPDATNKVYEYSCNGTFQMGPLVSLAGVPFISAVPGLGKPFVMTYTAHRALEHLKGLDSSLQSFVGYSPNPDGSVGNVGASSNNGTSTPVTGDWNTPNIYQLIAAAGERVVSSNILQVPADQANWTDTTLAVLPNQQLWLDSQATGTWGNQTTGSVGWDKGLDANGSTGEQTQTGGSSALPGQGRFLLAGRLGQNPVFAVGKTLQNYAINQTGPLMLNCNDDPQWRSQDGGVQTVRVIITSKN